MNIRTTITAGVCLTSICVAPLVAQAAEPYYEIKLEDTLVSGYQSGDVPAGNAPGQPGAVATPGRDQAPGLAVKLPDVLVGNYQTSGTDSGHSNASNQPGGFGFTAYELDYRGGVSAAAGDGSVRFMRDVVPVPADGKAKLGSLNGVAGVDKLFLNSRGGDQATGLLLPAINPAREAARSGTCASCSGGGAGKVQMQDFPGVRAGSPAAGGGGGAGKAVFQDMRFSTAVAKAGGAGAAQGAGPGIADIIVGTGPGAPGGHVKATDTTRTPGGLAAGAGTAPHVKTLTSIRARTGAR